MDVSCDFRRSAPFVTVLCEPAFLRVVSVLMRHDYPPARVQAAADHIRVDPADEIIRLGPLAVRFLVTGEDSNGTVAAFELTVPGTQRLAAPAHSHDQYEETIYGIEGILTWTVNGKQIDVGPGQALCVPHGAVHRFDNHVSTAESPARKPALLAIGLWLGGGGAGRALTSSRPTCPATA